MKLNRQDIPTRIRNVNAKIKPNVILEGLGLWWLTPLSTVFPGA